MSTGYRGAYGESLRRAGEQANARVISRSAFLRASDRASVASEGEGATNLESSTHLHQPLPGYSVTLLDFGDGIVEARACVTQRKHAPKSPKLSEEDRAERQAATDAERREWSRRRAARSLRYRCLALKADRMFTFTKRGKFDSVEELHSAWERFHRLLKKFPNVRMPFVAVPELHKDKATWHLHVAVRGFFDVSFVRRLWFRALGGRGDERGDDTPGNVHVKYYHQKRKAALVTAAYMSKYLGKGFGETQGSRKSYWCSRGLHPVSLQKFWEPLGDDICVRLAESVAPLIARRGVTMNVHEWEYVGLSGVIVKTF